MKSTTQKLLLISFALALIAAGTVFLYLQSLKPSNEKAEETTVLVAAETIPARTLIDKKMMKEIKVPKNSIFNDYIKDSSKIIGKYAKDTIVKDEGFHIDKLLDKGGNELSLKIDPDYRAISINVAGDSGVSDLLKPGDYVDIISYVAEKKEGSQVVSPDTAKIILQNIKLLAVDKQLSSEDEANDKKSDAENKVTNFLVTLSVPKLDVEKLVLAESIGSIKLALRPLKDNTTTDTNGTTFEELNVSTDSNKVATVNQENSKGNIISEKNGSETYKSYTVKYGDTLKGISQKFYGDKNKYIKIKQANNIKDENLIRPGQVIKIPTL
jgi:Flp pilus assembly protein CpaB